MNDADDDWPGTHHLVLVRAEGAAAPADPTDGVTVYTGAAFSNRLDFVHRSSKEYSYAVFACAAAGACSRWYADGTGTEAVSTVPASDNEASAATAPERFELSGITGEFDIGGVVSDIGGLNAPSPFFYPSGYSNAGSLALYASVEGLGTAKSKIYYLSYTGAVDGDGWPSDPNNISNWAETLVAEGSVGSDSDHQVSHPWVMLSQHGTVRRVQLFVQSQWQEASSHYDEVIQIESTDDVGDDFGLGCTTTCSVPVITDGYVAIAADGTSGTRYVEDARHGRVVWDYVGDGAIDRETDIVTMFVTADRPGSGPCANSGPDDIIKATGAYEDYEWLWDVATDGGSPDCPVVQVEDAHDPTMIALPNGEYKMYYRKTDGTNLYYVSYWNGSAWEDTAEIAFYWDGSATSGPSHSCVRNLGAVNKAVTGGGKEALFFRLEDSDEALSGTGLDKASDSGAVEDGAIVYAKLANG